MTMRPQAPDLSELRRRTSVKWCAYPADVLPMFVAEMDFELAPVVADAMVEQIRASDVGYSGGAGAVGDAFAGFAQRRWGWDVAPADVRLTTDVSVVIVEALRVAISPGDRVIITPPVYPPFFELIPEAGGQVCEVPLRCDENRSWSLDLAGIESELAAGARAVLLCHPHNPLGLIHPVDDLVALADLARQHGAVVISDEIHAPLVHPGREFTPFLATGEAARQVGVAAHSASKGFNIAGAKCALMIAASGTMRSMLDRQPEEVGVRTSIIGRAGTAAGFAKGDAWLDATLEVLVSNIGLLSDWLESELPEVRLHRPAASYLAWLDFRATDLGDDPAAVILEKGRVALHSGPAFGLAGRGFARLNVGCSPELLRAGLEGIQRAVR
ncbi:aminotransferase class I/II-fold pyridoxal phosphate-dependent enzyme [Gordonia sp. Z-3]|uniref:MalY/PatB family protein n=1 Tax=unclassified Gordonia (in: high G+C Gram-positive bacteria) TaxID=2657482 RepID=UPI0025799AFD|nr:MULTISPECIES: aminotransferase class I/II-fold pyridoxal phosphate-dependent enzyme [unclassified Gordonia (in: high G+C Gram-positive bacteria)]MED5801031.1 aminotransferase class I/II-fold pyridoxal phosphate-dependent enzyme [Gordonia sp. Z-3]